MPLKAANLYSPVILTLASTPPGTHPPNILVGGTSTGISPNIITYFQCLQC